MMIEKKLLKIPLAEIDFKDNFLWFSVGEPPEDLEKSIRVYGVLSPPFVFFDPGKSRYLIVTGFRRLEIARKLGFSEVECFVLGNNIPTEDIFFLALNERIGKRELNPAEKSLVIMKSVELLGKEKTIERVLPLIGLEQSKKILDQYLLISRLGELMLDSLAAGKVSVQAAVELCKVSERDRKKILELLLTLGCSASIQKELVVFCREIAAREEISIKEVLSDPAVQKILNDPRLNRRQKTAFVREYLRKRRFPLFTRKEIEFGEKVERMKLPSGVFIKPPHYFEGDRWSIELIFRSPDDLKAKMGAVTRVIDGGLMQELME